MRIELAFPFSSERIAGLLHLPCPPAAPTYIYAISTDSREASPFDLFVDFVGDQFHQRQAATQAALLLCPPCLGTDWESKALFVQDVKAAFLTLATAYGRHFPCRRVAVGGSAGKTTAKEYLFSVLSKVYRTQKSHGNFNNEIGLAYTLFSLHPKTEYLIAELGMNHAGELRRLSCALSPQSVILTNIGDAHLGNFNSIEELTDAKMEILEGMSPDGGLFYGADSPPLQNRAFPCNALSVGLENADYRILNIRTDTGGTTFDLMSRQVLLRDLKIPSFGKYTALSAAFAVAFAVENRMDGENIKEGLLSFTPPPLRQNVEVLKDGTTLFLDCYNASPASMRASMETVCGLHTAPSVLLGGMNELGAFTEALHREIGAYAYKMGIRYLFAFGKYAHLYAEGAMDAGMSRDCIFLFDAPNRACAEAIRQRLTKKDFLLIKASRGERAEEILTELLKIQEE